MPGLDWEAFANSSGDPKRNWELLCRGLIDRNYGRYGRLRSLRQQPGVEFHLLLEEECGLGEPGRWWGWQCRWYDLPKDKSLGQQRRAEILKAINTTERHLQGLTDWVLWLRELPRKSDITWVDNLNSRMRLHLWSEANVENLLGGEAAVLRSVYFGELVVTQSQLELCHARAVAPIEERWDPLVHIEVDVERDLRGALAEPQAFHRLREHAAHMTERANELNEALEAIAGDEERRLAGDLVADLRAICGQLLEVADGCDGGRPREATEASISERLVSVSQRELRRLAARLRAQRSPASLIVPMADADVHDGTHLLKRARNLLTAPLIGVVGQAGRGKSYLAAELTAATNQRPAGVLILASHLAADSDLNDLARRVPGIEVQTFDELLEAVNAAAARVGRRLPIVIDGLNDAQKPLRWRDLLAQLAPVLPLYPYVCLILTLRPSIEGDVLPDEAMKLTLYGFEHNVDEAVARYFEYYRIDPGSAWLPMDWFKEPLFLRMFCEATNPDRQQTVGVEALPASLTAVFERYLETVANRIRDRLELPPKYVSEALDKIAMTLWDRTTRDLPSEEVMELVGDDPRDWDRSLVRALEEDGVLSRDSGGGGTEQRNALLFDPFGGYLIADALMRLTPAGQLADVMGSAETWNRLNAAVGEGHPLAEDILLALVGVLPRRVNRHLWTFAPDELRDWALAQTALLEGAYLDPETVDALANLVAKPRFRGSIVPRDLFDRLMEVRDGPAHPLNAEFTDRVLRSLSVAARDLRWTEWVRARANEHLEDLSAVEERWVSDLARDESDRLTALWFAWLLTSTVRPLRDRVTRALYWFGRGDAAALFELTLRFLNVDDPYVSERLLAASYGVAMAHQLPDAEGRFETALQTYLRGLSERLFADGASSPTSHCLAREYVRGTFEFAARLHPSACPEGVDAHALPLAPGPVPETIEKADARAAECNKTFRMDFQNYTVGHLVENRGNYDMEHANLEAILAEIRGRIWNLGWRAGDFEDLDGEIARHGWRQDLRPERTERYGKKYGWIGYYEAAGRLAEQGRLRERYTQGRLPEVDIDPSFPEAPPPAALDIERWIKEIPENQEDWVRNGVIRIGDDLIRPLSLGGEEGPWVLVEGWLADEDEARQRSVFGLFRGFLVKSDDVGPLVEALETRPYLGNWLVPDAPKDYYTFAGEIPWSDRFAADVQYEEGLQPYKVPIRVIEERPDVTVELLAHDYTYESHHSTLNRAGANPVPSKRLASELGLYGRPQSFDLVEVNGQVASRTLQAPPQFSEGYLLYLREDLLQRYAHERQRTFVSLAWGERRIIFDWHQDPPDWLVEASRTHADLWRHVSVPDLGGAGTNPASLRS